MGWVFCEPHGRRFGDRHWLGPTATMVAARRCPVLSPPALMIFVMRVVGTVTSYPDASVKLRRRPRPVPVRWGHERLVGCRALEPCH
jgi:hypothetical protein